MALYLSGMLILEFIQPYVQLLTRGAVKNADQFTKNVDFASVDCDKPPLPRGWLIVELSPQHQASESSSIMRKKLMESTSWPMGL